MATQQEEKSTMTAYNNGRPVLYVGQDDPDSKEAERLLADAGLEVDVKPAPIHYQSTYGTPVLFGLFNKFEGIRGIRVFIKNATFLRTGA